MDEIAYRQHPAINWSTLRAMAQSPLAYRHAVDVPRTDTDAFRIGRAVHTLVLEPERFASEYVTWTGGRRAGKDWHDFCLEHVGKTVLTMSMSEIVVQIASSVIRDPLALGIVRLPGSKEQPIFWTDPATGLHCKARPDLVARTPDDRLVLADLKVCRSVDGRAFGRTAASMQYPHQLAHYASGCEHALGEIPDRHLLIAVEGKPPHDVAVFEVDPVAKEISRDEVAALLARVRECMDTDRWPGRYDAIQTLQLPAYVYTDDDDLDATGLGLIHPGQE